MMDVKNFGPERFTDQSEIVVTSESSYVTWDGQDDPSHPRNWSVAKKRAHVLLVSSDYIFDVRFESDYKRRCNLLVSPDPLLLQWLQPPFRS
jgi:hypothetical protein